jgi:hypothetical protein
MSLDKFADNMNRRGDNVPREVNKIKRKAALAIDQTIVMATPVLTGRARSNWQTSIDAPTEETREAFSLLVDGDMSESANAAAAMKQGRDIIAQVKSGQEIHIVNNLPYIGRLNEGHSAQAPAAFVEQAVEAGRRIVKMTPTDTGKKK